MLPEDSERSSHSQHACGRPINLGADRPCGVSATVQKVMATYKTYTSLENAVMDMLRPEINIQKCSYRELQ